VNTVDGRPVVIETIPELREKLAGHTVALVPTMGALHEGHLALVDRARQLADTVVVSIFVNPLQFGPGEDLDKYPRDLSGDLETLSQHDVAYVFAPTVAEMYPDGGTQIIVTGGEVGTLFEGRSRPGHFDGVLTVVGKLLHLTRPQLAYFGQKDAQQLAVIRRMTADLALGVEIRAVETVREPDGLALSSRNAYLSPEERRRAPSLHRALVDRDPSLIEGDVDYLAVVDADTFAEVDPRPGALVIGAARFGSTRLIDNIRIEGR